jgi:hypothetical protein
MYQARVYSHYCGPKFKVWFKESRRSATIAKKQEGYLIDNPLVLVSLKILLS